ncbi:M50 family metallopeptidase [Niallia nealsonii]|uniref:Uncharacterized protein n=1 Tax=Niallia nealsonii TaxID=115979 RepID=A0A2N0Z1E5_9BACI|nr:M50 family metallopeptidase [Niallia nealsonii]PKG23323.1 hypothetical protein CWS01_12815 [Niallia nealsonii]
MKDAFLIIIYLGAALIISRISFLKVYFSIWNTLILETFLVFIGGKNNRLIGNKDKFKKRTELEKITLKNLFNLYIGYTVTLVVAIGLFYLAGKQNYYLILCLLIGLLVLALFLWIRNPIRCIWIITCILLLAIPLYFNQKIVIMHIGIFLPSIILVQSILDSCKEIKRSIINRNVYTSKGFLARLKWIPAMIVGLLLLGQSLYAGFFIVKTFLS